VIPFDFLSLCSLKKGKDSWIGLDSEDEKASKLVSAIVIV
jgi:hypothetical protein